VQAAGALLGRGGSFTDRMSGQFAAPSDDDLDPSREQVGSAR
jgi:hypothetical protein